MTSTIRVSAAAKRALETLRRRWEKTEGRRLTQAEAAGRAFAILADSPDLDPPTAKPWTRKQWKLFEDLMAVNDPAVSSTDIDDVLYGPKA